MRIVLLATMLMLSNCESKLSTNVRTNSAVADSESEGKNNRSQPTTAKSKTSGSDTGSNTPTSNDDDVDQDSPTDQNDLGSTEKPPVNDSASTDNSLPSEITVTLSQENVTVGAATPLTVSLTDFAAVTCSVLSVTATNAATCQCVAPQNCSITITPNASFSGPLTLEIEFEDSDGKKSTTSTSVVVRQEFFESALAQIPAFTTGAHTNSQSSSSTLQLVAGTADDKEFDSLADYQVSSTGLIGYWKLNGTIGAIGTAANAVLDSGPNGFHLTAGDSDPAYATGNAHQGVLFGGGNDVLHTPRDPAMEAGLGGTNLTSNLTISLWVKVTSCASTGSKFFERNESGDGLFDLNCYSGADVPEFRMGDNFVTVSGQTDITDNQWHHIVGVKNGAWMYLYVNAVIEGASDDIVDAYTIMGDIRIGHSVDGGSRGVNGIVDEVIYFNRALSEQEIVNLYDRHQSPYGWRPQAEYVSRVFDSGATGNELTGISWKTDSPYGKALPIGAVPESGYSGDHADSAFLTDLVGYWNMDGAEATAATSLPENSGAGFTGTVTDANSSVVYSSATFGQGLKFDGELDVITIPDDPDLKNFTALTMSIWVNPDAEPDPQYSHIFSKNDATSSDYGLSWAATGDEDRYKVVFRITTGSVLIFEAGGTLLPNSGWHHIAGTWDGATVRVYLDGQEIGSTPKTGTLNDAGDVLAIGGHPSDSDRRFSGYLDEAALWKRALSAAEIRSLYKRGQQPLKFQVRSCPDASCTGVNFLGPDLTPATHFTAAGLSGGPTFTQPIAGLPTGRFFQYKVEMETFDSFQSPKIEEIQLNLAP